MSYFARVDGTGQHQVSRASADFNQVVVKVDHQVTNNDQLTGHFIDHFDNAAIMTPGDLLSYRMAVQNHGCARRAGCLPEENLSATR
jgi:hypothetical protein